MWTIVLGPLFDRWLHNQELGLQEKVLADLIRIADDEYSFHLSDLEGKK